MRKAPTKRQRAIRRRNLFLIGCSLLLVLCTVGLVAAVRAVTGAIRSPHPTDGKPTVSSSSGSEKKNQTPKVTATATVINTGDLLIHNPVLNGAYHADTDTYDFSAFFPNVSRYFKAADLAVINLEVSLGGKGSGSYKGYPAFNTPDCVLDTCAQAGISFFLTANNHCYDTGAFGLKRTVQVLKEKNLAFLGTRETESDPVYRVQKVSGVRIGMACYTYENKCDLPGRKSLNGNIVAESATNLVNSFAYERLDAFYESAETAIAAMKNDGADCIVFYLHWGEEYQLQPNSWQTRIAQTLCDLGVDVIVGSHPHVLQPISLLSSTDNSRQTVCLYSMGNSISNQRTEELTGLCNTGHTEDGVLFSYTFTKYSDGKTVLSGVDAIPTWVNKIGARYNATYTMIPLEAENDGAAQYGLTGKAASSSAASYRRTREMLAEGLTACQTALGCPVRFTD